MEPTAEELAAQEAEQSNQNNNSTTAANPIEDLIKQTLGEAERARIALEHRLAERDREYADLQAKLQNQNSSAANQEQKIDNSTFWTAPADNLNNMINQQVQPLVGFVEEMKRDRAYNALKTQYRAQYPAFAQIEFLVDKYMTNREVSHASMQSAIREAVGEVALSQGIGGDQNNNTNQNTNNNQNTNTNQNQNTNAQQHQTTQAHLRPTNTTNTTVVDDKPKRRPLTELERRMIKETPGMTEDKYFELLGAGPQVSDWKEKAGAK